MGKVKTPEETLKRKEYQKQYHKQWREKHKEEIVEYRKQYKVENKEKLAEYERKRYPERREERIKYENQWRADHKKELSEYKKQWRAEHKEDISEKYKVWRLEHKDEKSETDRKWKVENKDKVNTSNQKRRTLRKKLQSVLTVEQWEESKKYFGNKCAYCGEEKPLTQDHFIALSRGGEYSLNNIIPACKTCNCSKGSKYFVDWYPKSGQYSRNRETKLFKFLNYKNEIQQLVIY